MFLALGFSVGFCLGFAVQSACLRSSLCTEVRLANPETPDTVLQKETNPEASNPLR